MDGQFDGQKKIDGWVDCWMVKENKMDGWTKTGWFDVQGKKIKNMDGWMDVQEKVEKKKRWMDGYIEKKMVGWLDRKKKK